MKQRNQNRLYSPGLLSFFALLTLLLYLPFPSKMVLAQNTREERCQNNQTSLGKLEKESRQLESDLSWTDEKIARARTSRQALYPLRSYTPSNENKLNSIASEYNFDLQACIAPALGKSDLVDKEYREARAACISELFFHIDRQVIRAGLAQPRRAAMQQRKAYLDNQIAYHRGRMVELGCDGKTVTPVVDAALAARLQRFAGTWYSGGRGQCWQLSLSVSGGAISGSSQLFGPFVDTGDLEGNWNGAAFAYQSKGRYSSDGCTTCKNKQGTRLGSGTLRYNESGPAIEMVFNESDKSEIFPGRQFSGRYTKSPCK